MQICLEVKLTIPFDNDQIMLAIEELRYAGKPRALSIMF